MKTVPKLNISVTQKLHAAMEAADDWSDAGRAVVNVLEANGYVIVGLEDHEEAQLEMQRADELEDLLRTCNAAISTLNSTITAQRDTIAEQAKRIQEQGQTISNQGSAIVELNTEVARLKRREVALVDVNDRLKKDYETERRRLKDRINELWSEKYGPKGDAGQPGGAYLRDVMERRATYLDQQLLECMKERDALRQDNQVQAETIKTLEKRNATQAETIRIQSTALDELSRQVSGLRMANKSLRQQLEKNVQPARYTVDGMKTAERLSTLERRTIRLEDSGVTVDKALVTLREDVDAMRRSIQDQGVAVIKEMADHSHRMDRLREDVDAAIVDGSDNSTRISNLYNDVRDLRASLTALRSSIE